MRRSLVGCGIFQGALKKGVNAEREAFVAAMTVEGFGKGTIDVYWQRVKEASGYITAGNRVKGSTSVDDKTKADLQTIINRIFKAEEDGVSCVSSEHKGALMEVFADLGGDLAEHSSIWFCSLRRCACTASHCTARLSLLLTSPLAASLRV